MKSTSTAEAISAQLLALLPQHPAEATVHSVFHTSANLLYQGQLVTLLDDTRPLYPCAVRLGGSIPSVAAGEPALLSRERPSTMPQASAASTISARSGRRAKP